MEEDADFLEKAAAMGEVQAQVAAVQLRPEPQLGPPALLGGLRRRERHVICRATWKLQGNDTRGNATATRPRSDKRSSAKGPGAPTRMAQAVYAHGRGRPHFVTEA